MKTVLRNCLLGSFILLNYSLAFAQDKTISGRVTNSADNTPIPGVSVVLKGTSTGTITNIEGEYQISVPDNSTLAFSSIGFTGTEVAVGDRSSVDVSLNEDVTSLDEVVVTALGVTREKKSLTYAADAIDGEELTQSKDASFMNALSGKTAGVQINRSGSGVGGSTRVILRGNSSTRDNNVLYVIDGVPMLNYSPSQPNDIFGGGGTGGTGRDGGDAVSNLNPEDIETMTVLKGASAAALYGSQAANGAIVITTKSGKEGKTEITFSTNYTTESILVEPELQFSYGQTTDGSLDSWGSKVKASDHVDDFFQKGKTLINSITLSGGNEKAQSYFSYANTDSKGIIPTSTFKKHNFNFKESAKFLNDKLTVTANTNYIIQEAHNRPTSGLYYNTLTGLYQFPRGLNFSDYEKDFEKFDAGRNVNIQNWTADFHTQQNPFWILKRNQNEDSRSRVILNASAKYDISDALSIRVKGTIDNSNDLYEQKSYASTQGTLADKNGRYVRYRTNGIQKYGEVLVSYRKVWENLSLSANLGSSVNDTQINGEFADSKGAGDGLNFANLFNLQNIAQPGSTISQTANNSQLQSVFGSINIGYKGMLYFDVTGRNDWSSTLAFTDDVSFFYPSVGLTGIVSEFIDLPDVVDLLKVRASYAKVGNGVSAFDTNVLRPIGSGSNQAIGSIADPNQSLRPEEQTSTEIGIELSLLQRRVGVDFTKYKNHTIDQRISIATSPTTNQQGADFLFVNAGDIKNKGIELGISGTPIKSGDFSWNARLNYASNKNKVVELNKNLDSQKRFILSDGGVNKYQFGLTEGGSFGDIYVRKFERKNGKIVVDESGVPQAEVIDSGEEELKLIGSINPDFTWGFGNDFNYKNFSVSFLITGSVGGKVLSFTEAINSVNGVSQRTADARDAGEVNVDVVLADGTPYTTKIDPKAWYSAIGGRDGITENYVYSATNIRLRELVVGYNIPIDNVDFIERARFSIVGRNLFFFKNDAPYDPDVSASTGTGLQGVDIYSMPSTRSLGFNLSVTF